MRWRRSEADWRLFKQLEFTLDFCSRPALSGRCEPHWQLHGDRAPWLQHHDHALEFQARELLRALGADNLAREVRVEWNPRMKSAAGRADYREKLISLNPLLINHGDEIDRTLRHELAHLLAQWRVGRRRIAPHGSELRQASHDLGIADVERCN